MSCQPTFQRIEDRLDGIEKVLAVNTKVLSYNSDLLCEHERRSRASEGRLAVLEHDQITRDRAWKILAWAIPVVLALGQIAIKFL